MPYLDLKDKTVVVFGVANRKSVAHFIAKALESVGAKVIYVVRDEEVKAALEKKLLKDREIHTCDVESDTAIIDACSTIGVAHAPIHGIVHSIAFANFEDGLQPFHATKKENFLQAMDISCFSLVKIANAMKDYLDENAAVVTISISSTNMAAESYGYMAPIKAALDSSVVFLAKSFSRFSKVRFNAVKAGPLKTSASAGIPGYIDNYLFTEKATLRKQAVQTQEVADTAMFLLSPKSSGINAQGIIVDAGMAVNYFDEDIVQKVARDLE